MAMTAEVENYCNKHNHATKMIYIEGTERACINCIWYDPYLQRNRGNISMTLPSSTGFCLRKEVRRSALGRPCKDFKAPERR